VQVMPGEIASGLAPLAMTRGSVIWALVFGIMQGRGCSRPGEAERISATTCAHPSGSAALP
jgi:hypothetical protein